MFFRKAASADLAAALAVLEDARAFLRDSGVNQWQRNGPGEEELAEDLALGRGYVAGEEEVQAYCAICPGQEPDYAHIEEGAWLGGGPYLTLHRVAVAGGGRGKGLGRLLFARAQAMAGQAGVASLRVDTHRHNLAMQGLLARCGFSYCGIIYLLHENGPKARNDPACERFAYEKLLQAQPEEWTP